MNKILGLLFSLIVVTSPIVSQSIPYHVDNEAVYSFVDELANLSVIDVNQTIKPYSRMQIANWLSEANGNVKLTTRQQREIEFYLKDFNKELQTGKAFKKRFDLFYFSDSLVKISANLIGGLTLLHNGESLAMHRTNGAELFTTYGKHLGIYASLRDNYESDKLGGQSILSQRRGVVYKGDFGEQDYSEARGGITYSWNWGTVGLQKDHFVWGSGYNGTLIFSGHTPSFTYLSLKLKPTKWFELNYIHGWLVSEVVDSSLSYNYYEGMQRTRKVNRSKYIAANILTFKPWKKLDVSLGNSIVYGDVDINPTYLIPLLFYKSADHTYNSNDNDLGQNAQMFMDISSHQLPYTHLYFSAFVDEISFKRMFDASKQSNYVSAKIGAQVSGLVPNMSFTAEYTRINPMVYQHVIETTTFESNHYTLGHYLKDNADELFLQVRWKPLRGLNLQASLIKIRKSKDYESIISNNEVALYPEINTDEPRWGLPFMNEIRMKQTQLVLKATYQIWNDAYMFAEARHLSFSGADATLYTAPYFLQGKNILSFGANFGF